MQYDSEPIRDPTLRLDKIEAALLAINAVHGERDPLETCIMDREVTNT